MTRSLSAHEVLRLRMRAQRLAGARATDVRAVLRGVGALQAQDTRASRLAVRPRSAGLDAAAVIRACNEERSVVRTWAMRGTLHMVPAEDAGWLVALLGPIFVAADRRRRLQLGLDDDLCARALPAMREILSREGPRTRAALVRQLAGEGVSIDSTGQAPAHLVGYAAAHGLVCRGPDQEDDEPTYVLLEEWVGKQPEQEHEAALAALARRYLDAYGPATVQDFAVWAGIALGQARQGFQLIAGDLEAVEVSGQPAWILAAVDPETADRERADAADPCVRLLPTFDTYLLGYRSRDLALAPQFAQRIQAGGGWIHPAMVVDGRVVGTWRQQRKGDRLTILAQPFEPLDRRFLPYLEAEAADVGRFLGAPAALIIGG
jgi:hypothetical protein